eukprot:GFKZ01007015.1.p1 GENE.GFKZ01007015.1~~GFKZ01007015.1.p1  ORF type:complete len:481 (+),score=57.35 GFKZ01007015.1:306-1748(+)
MSAMTSPESEKHVGKWLVDPTRKNLLIELFSVMFYISFSLLEAVAVVLNKWMKTPQKTRHTLHSIGDRTQIARSNSLQRTNSADILREWINRYKRDRTETGTHAVYDYPSFSSLCVTLFFYTAWLSYGKQMAKLVLSDQKPTETASRVLESVKRIRARAKKSVKFRFQFKDLLHFLDDLEKSRACSVTDFLNEISAEILNLSNTGVLGIYHTRFRCKFAARNVHETGNAVAAQFVREGANVNAFFSEGMWRDPSRTHHAAMMVMMHFAMTTCAPNSSNEINITEYSGVERSLLSKHSGEFRRQHSLWWYGDLYLQKDMILIDVSLNDCNEFVELAWSWEVLDRAVWALEHGRKHVRRELYFELTGLDGRKDLDLTGYDARQLLIFSLAGVVRFSSEGDSVYDITGSEEARTVIHGKLPLPCVEDLVALDLVKSNKRGMFWIDYLPGTRDKFTFVNCNGYLRMTRTTYPKKFRANLDELVL